VQVTDATVTRFQKSFTLAVNAGGGVLTFTTQPSNTTAGQAISPAVHVRLQDNSGAVLPAFPISLALGSTGTNPGGGTLSGTLSALTDATGTATFSNLVISAAGTGYTLVASSNPGIPTATSTSFNEAAPPVTPFVGRGTDPAGDAGAANPDLVVATVSTTADGNVTLSVRYASGTFNSSTTEAEFLIDTDRNIGTGSPGSNSGCTDDAAVLGTDYLVVLRSGFAQNQAQIYKATGGCNAFQALGTAPVTIVTDGMNVTFPLSLLNNTASATTSGPATTGPWSFKVTTDTNIGQNEFSGVQDTMPDVGFADSTTAAVITGVVFAGSPANPTITINGTGFGTAPTATTIAFDGSTGFDYGDQLYIFDLSNNPQNFSAGLGYPNASNSRDFIGLVIVSYTDTSITYQLGSDYSDFYFPQGIYGLNAGDSFAVFVGGGASFSGTVSYPVVIQ